ncbi:MAG: right-handed parallel beta-helix repeat-containing protein, partial [Allosphingosinicella sp.]
AGGEINCLDPGGFGAVTINKSLVIDCHYTEGGALAGGNGITVNAASTDVITIRGLDIFGVNPPSNGVRIIAAGAVHIEDCVIRRFNAVNSLGVSFAPTTANTKLYISNTTITENGNGFTGGGIEINPGVGGSGKVVVRNSRIQNNGSDGIRMNSANGVINLVVEDTDISGNAQGVAVLGSANATLTMITNSVIANNSVIGIVTTSNAITRIDNTTITGNTQGVSAQTGSQILSYGGNHLDGNPTSGAANDGAFTGGVIPRK